MPENHPTTNTSPAGGRWLTIQEAAEHYRVHPHTIRRRIADGTLTAERFGPRLMRVRVTQ